MKKLMALLILAGMLFGQQAMAQVTSPVSVTASSTFSSYTLVDLINQDGITGNLDGGTHYEEYFTMWMSDGGDITPQLTFDMGAVVSVNAAHIWQYNAACCGFDRGVAGFDIYISSDDISYTYAGSATLTEAGGGDIPAQVVPTSFTARYIRFDVTSNHGEPNYTGLSEVAFEIGVIELTPPVSPVPTLSQWMLLVLLLLIGGVAIRRLRFS